MKAAAADVLDRGAPVPDGSDAPHHALVGLVGLVGLVPCHTPHQFATLDVPALHRAIEGPKQDAIPDPGARRDGFIRNLSSN